LKVAFHTLGCKLNFSETSTIAREFKQKGFERVNFGEPADVIVLNTCTVTEFADKKCEQAIAKAKKQSPNAFIAVTGCYAQSDAEKISKLPGVDIVLGMNEKFNIFQHVSNFTKIESEAEVHSCETSDIKSFDGAFSSGDRTRSFLKVQDGCDYPCTYCKIPSVRGKSRNKSISATVKDAQLIANEGFKEIILTGVNIGDFGKTTGESFFDLIKALDVVEGIERIRISSVEPNLLTDEIIDFCKESNKFLPHFHIPLQSGSNKILREMKRRYNRERFADRVQKIKSVMPESFIGVDVIVGFPGETDDDFNETYTFLESLDISFLHVFSYSVRSGTPAADMQDMVRREVIVKRSERLHNLSTTKQRAFYDNNIGQIRPVLWESKNAGGKMFGFTDNYIKTETNFDKLLINRTIKVKLIGNSDKETMLCEFLL